jgi:hypothetical protein
MLLAVILPAPKPRSSDILEALRYRIAGIVGACLLVIAIAMALAGLSLSYCARPQGISIPAIPFGERRIYAWSDIRKITTDCYAAKGWFYFDAEMNDGRTIPLGYRNKNQFIRNYRAVSDALRDVPFTYDNSGISECRPPLRDLLATRPGAHGNEPSHSAPSTH